MLPAGALRERVTVERPVASDDDAGGQEDVWAPVVSDYRARVRAVGGSNQTTNEALGSVWTYEITLRLTGLTSTILATDRVTWRDLVLRIDGVIIDREAREVRMQCSAGAAVNV